MQITDVQAFNLEIPYKHEYRPAWQPGLVRHSRDFTLVKIITEDGLTGWGGTDGHHAGNILKNVKPYLVGRDAFATESHQRTIHHAYGMWLVDQALWDLVGQAAKLPLYKLWGYCRDRVRAYGSTSELGTPADRAALARRYRSEGFQAMKIRFHKPTLEEDLEFYDAVAEAVPDMKVMVDANQATNLPSPERSPVWDYQRALRTARALEERGAVWLEEPLSRYDFEHLVRLRENTEINIAGGESNRQLHEFRWLIEKGVYDIIQPDVSLSEGISQVRKIAAMAEMFKRHFNPHHGLSGLGLAATLHLSCTIPGDPWLELMYEPPTRTLEDYQRLGGILKTEIFIDSEGYLHPPQGPGLGVEVDEEMIGRYHVG